jgi:hypothetical protein
MSTDLNGLTGHQPETIENHNNRELTRTLAATQVQKPYLSMRIARTVTGRSLVVAFTGAYHGINDEALACGSKSYKLSLHLQELCPKQFKICNSRIWYRRKL